MASPTNNINAENSIAVDHDRLPTLATSDVDSFLQHESRSDEWVHVQKPEGLKVIIAGGGLGGLTAALALRQQGHDVHVYESSSFSREIGAALNTAPNANGILKRLGISCKDIGANVAEWMSEYTYTGVRVKKIDLLAHNKIFEHNWRLAHRVKLHDALRKAATSENGKGRPVEIHLSKAVKDVDATNAIVYFKDGSSVQGDIIIGADGVHSVTRTKLPGGDMQPFPSGMSAFRFLIPRESIVSDLRTAKFAEDDGGFTGIFGPDRSIIIYPTSNNTMLNFVCIHPDTESGGTESWGCTAELSRLLDVYKTFHPDVLALLAKADESSLKVWRLLDMAPLPNWYDGRLAVLGDAAHPFMPYLGQGAAIAIEDGVAMAVVLEEGLGRKEVPERLKLYQQIRKERAELVQHYTRLSGKSRGEKSAFDAAQYQGYCFGHDEWDHSTQKLREWKWAKSANFANRMTTVFGPTPSPQPSHRSQLTADVKPTFTIATIKFNTSRTVLDGLLPPGNKSFRFKTFGSIAQCTIRQTSFRGVPSLGGQGYNQLCLYIHGVEYKDEEGRLVNGAFLPIMFANMADTIIAGREELGVPELWSTIDIERDRESYHIRTGWEGLTWGNFYLEGLKLVPPSDTEVVANPLPDASQGDEGTLLHQYLPSLDSSQLPDQQQSERTTFLPYRKDVRNNATGAPESSLVVDNGVKNDTGNESRSTSPCIWRARSAHFNLNARDWDAYPTLHHIISRLQDIPILNVIEAKVVEGCGTPELV